MEILSNLNSLDRIPDGQTRKLPTIATTSAAGIVKPDGTSILIDENGKIKANYNMVMKTATFDPATAEFVSTDCTWTDVITAATEGYELTIMGSMGASTLWFKPEALSLIEGYKYGQFVGRSIIFGYLVTLTITVPETGVPYCTTIYSEKISEKVTSWSQTVNDTNYPSEKLVKDSLDAKAAVSDLATEVSTRSSQVQGLDERVARLEGSVQYYLLKLNEEAYINPSTLQPVSGRTYTDSDFANDPLSDINLKAWLKYNYQLHEIVDLNTAAVKVTGFEDGEEGLWEFWSNITNPSIGSYPSLQQVGQYVNGGTGELADFTNTVHGAIVGTAQDGYVTSDGGGKGKVHGWGDLLTRVSGVEALKRFPSNSTPLIDVQGGTVGTATEYARGDHQHPTDSTREAAAYKVSSWSASPNNNNYPTEKLVKDSLTAESSARSSADTALGTRIDNEAAARSSADAALASADTALSNRATALETFKNTTVPNTYATIASLTAETNARSSADTSLGTRIDNEVTARSSADSALSGRVTTLENKKVVVGDQTGYTIKVQSGTSGLPSDTKTLTFCY